MGLRSAALACQRITNGICRGCLGNKGKGQTSVPLAWTYGSGQMDRTGICRGCLGDKGTGQGYVGDVLRTRGQDRQ